MPNVYTDNLSARIGVARTAFEQGVNTRGEPFPKGKQAQMDRDLALTPAMRQAYIEAAMWGVSNGLITTGEQARLESVLAEGPGTDPETGWHLSADLATKVIVTKVCNELIQKRGDA